MLGADLLAVTGAHSARRRGQRTPSAGRRRLGSSSRPARQEDSCAVAGAVAVVACGDVRAGGGWSPTSRPGRRTPWRPQRSVRPRRRYRHRLTTLPGAPRLRRPSRRGVGRGTHPRGAVAWHVALSSAVPLSARGGEYVALPIAPAIAHRGGRHRGVDSRLVLARQGSRVGNCRRSSRRGRPPPAAPASATPPRPCPRPAAGECGLRPLRQGPGQDRQPRGVEWSGAPSCRDFPARPATERGLSSLTTTLAGSSDPDEAPVEPQRCRQARSTGPLGSPSMYSSVARSGPRGRCRTGRRAPGAAVSRRAREPRPPGHLSPHRDLRLGLRLADRARARRRPPPTSTGCPSWAIRVTSSHGRPGGAVHRALLPPGPDLLGHERQERREQSQLHAQRGGQRSPRRRGRRGVPAAAVGAVLDQLQVVVAERPEEASRSPRAPGCSCRPRRLRSPRPRRRPAQRAARGPAARSPRSGRSAAAASTPKPSTNRLALRILIASRRPIFIWPSSKAVSVPGPARGRPVAHRVGAVLVQQVDRGDDVALGLGHLLAVGVEDPPGDRRIAPRAAGRPRGVRAPPWRTARSG